MRWCRLDNLCVFVCVCVCERERERERERLKSCTHPQTHTHTNTHTHTHTHTCGGAGSTREWEAMARLVLDASYEACMWVAVERACAHEALSGSKTLVLTVLGAGVFGNPGVYS